MLKLQQFLNGTTWEHEATSAWMEKLDYPMWQEYHNKYQDLEEQGKLRHLYQGPSGCQSGYALLINMSVEPYKDGGDVKDGWVATNCWGNFKGGLAVFPDLEFKISQEAGDLLFARTAVLEHWITPVADGQRFSNVRFTKGDILRPHIPIFDCPVQGCSRKMRVWSSIRRHVKSDHRELMLAERSRLSKKPRKA